MTGPIRTGFLLGTLAFGLGHVAAGEAAADPVVVELFTSQGCSSCPPADALLAELSERPDILPLALHVDYWDYIGWADTFADPRHTERQRAYSEAAGHGMIYTPQMVVGGVDHVGGFRPMQVADLIQAHQAALHPLTLEVAAGETLVIRITAPDALEAGQPMQVQVVGFIPHQVVDITRGENAGETFAYHNIVVSWDIVGVWTGEADFEASVPRPDAEGIAVVVQEEGPGRILAATRVTD